MQLGNQSLPKMKSKEIPLFEPLTGPINVTFGKRNFVMDTHRSASGDVDTPRGDWIAERLMMEWRRMVTFEGMKGTLLKSFNSARNKQDSQADNDHDEYFYKLAHEWVQLENVLVARALQLNEPRDAEFVRTLDPLDKLKIIGIQDRLNGFDIVRRMMEIQNIKEEAERRKKLQEKLIEERAKQIAQENSPPTASTEESNNGQPDGGLQP